MDLNSPAEFNDGVFSWLSPYGLVGLADLLLELGDQTESQVTYLAYLAYAKALTEDGGQQAAARQRMDVIKKRQDYQAVVAQIGKHQLPDGIASSQLLFSGNDCWSAYQQEKKKWALACAVSKKHPAALKLNAEISKDALRRAEIQAEVEARRRANEERLRQNEERSRLEWEALPSEKKAEEVGRKIGQGLGKAVDSITESEAGKSIKGFWKGLTE